MFQRKDTQFILWLTFLTVAAWIGFNVYHASATSTIDEVLQMQILPIKPEFDTEVINKLRSREKIAPVYNLEKAIVNKEATESAGADQDGADAQIQIQNQIQPTP